MNLDNICGYKLDEEQKKVVYCKNKNILVCAGAGSGKSLTIIGKIRYLIEKEKYNQRDILVISFTNDTVQSLKDKLLDNYNYNINVITFHKLGLKILNNINYNIDIVSSDYLEYTVDEYFSGVIIENEEWCKKILNYFKIKYKNIDSYINYIGLNAYEFIKFKKLIIKFIKLFRIQNYNIENFYNIMNKVNNKIFHKKYIFILRLILDIYLYYINELESSNKIDFDDMINLAYKHVDKITFSYKYVIIDEFQDTSLIKFKLIKKLVDKLDSNLLVVGDDFQSIYRFTGCDLNLFINFCNYFNDSIILKITNTYRSPYQLIYVAGSFIMKNKHQIKKNLSSSKNIDKPINIYYSNKLKEILGSLDEEVMIIGRNNFDIYKYIDNDFEMDNCNITYKNNPSLKIKYLTVHRSKGLESKNVIIINMVNGQYGFPSIKKDNKLIKYINNFKSTYYLDEERRLFYVALTRSKNKVYIITDKNNMSIFVRELIINYRKYLNIIK